MGSVVRVALVDDETVYQAAIVRGDCLRRDGNTQLGHDLRCRTLDRLTADDRRNSNDWSRGICKSRPNAGNGQNRINAEIGVRRTDHDRTQILIANEINETGSGLRGLCAIEANATHGRLATPLHEIALKRQITLGCCNDRTHGIVRHRQNLRGNSELPGRMRRKLGQALPRTQPVGAQDVHGQIAIAKLKPGLAPQLAQRTHHLPCFLRPPPSPLRISDAAERIKYSVEIGRDVEPEMLEVISGVDDHRQLLGIERAIKAEREFGAADATAQREDMTGGYARIHRNISSFLFRTSAAAVSAGAS